jgi:hypothetical protein
MGQWKEEPDAWTLEGFRMEEEVVYSESLGQG